MIEIEYKGGNCVLVSTKNNKLVFDPNREVFGKKNISVKGAVSVATEERFKVKPDSDILSIDCPGAYEIGDFSINGFSASRHIDSPDDIKMGTIYKIEVEDIRFAVLGNIAPKITEDQLEGLGVVDVIIIPVGGNGYTLDATSAATIIRQIEPKVVIPVSYNSDGLKYEVAQDDLSVFTKELGWEVEESGDKYKIKNEAALPQSPKVVVIKNTD